MQNLHPTIAAALAPFAGIFGEPDAAPAESTEQRHRRLRSEAVRQARALNWQSLIAARQGMAGAAKRLRLQREGAMSIARRIGRREG